MRSVFMFRYLRVKVLAKVGEGYALKVNLREPLLTGVSASECLGDVLVYVRVVDRITKRR